jgi:hypothetical protein
MRNLSLAIIALTVLLLSLYSGEPLVGLSKLDPIKSPHGTDLKIGCNVCHSAEGWKIDKKILSFNHNDTEMPLIGQHAQTGCKLCHPTLVFSEANTECAQCHTDVHESTVGPECSRCHTPHSWLVNNITQIHQQSRFPLVGVHATVDCYQCHISEKMQRFEVIGTECYSCHSEEYAATKQPNHITAGYSTECSTCHNIFSKEWTGTGFNHNFFPLNQGHNITDCSICHVNGNYTTLSGECISCHQSDYNSTTNPVHSTLNFSTACNTCHSLAPGWTPAGYPQHDALSFPIYSGNHNGEWNSCTDCHTNPGNYQLYSCIDCHEHNKSKMDSKHNDENGYVYNSNACLNCHPRGEGDN